jgi:hypothetical protein
MVTGVRFVCNTSNGGSVWWGDADAVERLPFWQDKRIATDVPATTHVCNCASTAVCAQQHESVHYLNLPMLDVGPPLMTPEKPLWQETADRLREAVEFVEAACSAGGTVLVNCYAGQNRSGAVLLAWLLMHRGSCDLGSSPEAAFGHLKSIEREAVVNASLRRCAFEVAGATDAAEELRSRTEIPKDAYATEGPIGDLEWLLGCSEEEFGLSLRQDDDCLKP